MKLIYMATGGGGKDRPPKENPDDPDAPIPDSAPTETK